MWKGRRVITVSDLNFQFRGNQVLRAVTCQMPQGVTAIVGPNGAGKTTFLRLLATAEPCRSPDTISVDGLDPARGDHRRALRRELGFLPQAFAFHPGFTVAEFVRYIALLKGMHPHEVGPGVARAIALVDLTVRSGAKLGSLSGGMLRRAGIAQAIVNDPQIVILDEPTAGLDPRQRKGFREIIARVKEDRTVVLSTHLMDDVLLLADQLVILDEGQLRFAGSPQALTGTPTPTVGDIEARVEAVLADGEGASAW